MPSWGEISIDGAPQFRILLIVSADQKDMTVKCPYCGHIIREHACMYDPEAPLPDEEACPACGEVVDVFTAAHDQWLDSLSADRGPPDLILTGTCPGCGAMPQSKYWGDLSEVEFTEHCEECDLTFPMIPDREVMRFVCPNCNKGISPSATLCPSCGLRVAPSRCPHCHSDDLLVVTPSKPMFFSPISIAGVVAGAFAGAVADSLFSDFYRCRSCGNEWR